ncbi:MAG: IclR family transcriptional regulator [Nocardiopsaceae bacterium]|nr:IclR family transcriptional regulator [Nocardiopsaceae bacterium]
MNRPRTALSDDVSPLGSTSIQSVERAGALLRLFLPSVGSLGPTDIAQRSGMSVSTAHRYCAALRRAGLLRYDPATGRYGLGGGCIELGLAAAESMPLVELARPLMSELVNQFDMTVVLSVWDEESVRVVAVNDHTSTTARITVRSGAQLGVFETAQGLVFLAFSPRVQQRFAQRPEMARVAASLEAAEREQCAIVTSLAGPTSIPGVIGAAVPVFIGGHIAATLGLIGPAESMPRSTDSPVIATMKETAARLSRQLLA